MGIVLKQITELLADGANYEESRSKGIFISSANWFDPANRSATSGSNPASTSPTRPGGKGKPRQKSEITWHAINEIS